MVLEIFVLVAMAIIAGLMILGGLRFVQLGMTQVSTTSGIRLAWVYLSVPVSGFSMLVFIVERAVGVLRGEGARHVSQVEAETGIEQ